MAEYVYHAIDSSGRKVVDRMTADRASEVVAHVEAMGLFLVSINPWEPHTDRNNLANDDSQALLRPYLSRVLEQRGPLGEALSAFAAELPAGRQRRELVRLADDLRSEASLDELLVRTPHHETWLPMLATGATQGRPLRYLPEMLNELGVASQIRRRLFYAAIYPLTIVMVAAGVFAFLSMVVAPIFEELMSDFSLQLPHLTTVTLGLSRWVRHHLFAMTLALAVLGLLAYWSPVLLAGSRLAERWAGWLTSGSLSKVASAAAFARRLSELLEADAPLPEALTLAGSCSRHAALRDGACWFAHDLAAGRSSHDARGVERLPASVVEAIDVYRRDAGAGAGLLRNISDAYAERVDERLSESWGLTAPLAVLGVGLIVALCVFSYFLPLVSLINGLSG
ncbi:MAG: type II secretion system F family protein [Planctomycetales bacterium]|nr:type II secretion system F family protein [Planctomycetales bacterium]